MSILIFISAVDFDLFLFLCTFFSCIFYFPDISENLFKLQIGGQKHWNVYTKSFLSFGHVSARRRHFISIADATLSKQQSAAEVPTALSYCLHAGYTEIIQGTPIPLPTQQNNNNNRNRDNNNKYTGSGSGNGNGNGNGNNNDSKNKPVSNPIPSPHSNSNPSTNRNSKPKPQSNSNSNSNPSYNPNGNTDYNSNLNSDSDGTTNSPDGNIGGSRDNNSDTESNTNFDVNSNNEMRRNQRYQKLDENQINAPVRRSNYNYDNNDKNKFYSIFNEINNNKIVNNIDNNNQNINSHNSLNNNEHINEFSSQYLTNEHIDEHNTEHNNNDYNNKIDLQYLTNEDNNQHNNQHNNDHNSLNNNQNTNFNLQYLTNEDHNNNYNSDFNLQYLTNEVEISGPAGPAADQFDRCLKALRPLLEKDHGHLCMLVYDGECSIDGAYQPILPDDGRFIGTSSYVLPWEILMLPDTANLELYRSRAENVCSLSFEDVLQYYEMKGLVDSDSKLAEMLPYFCFLSSYAYVLLVGTYIFNNIFSLSSCSCSCLFIFYVIFSSLRLRNQIKSNYSLNLI